MVKRIADKIIKTDPSMAAVKTSPALRQELEQQIGGYMRQNVQVIDRYVSPGWKADPRDPVSIAHYNKSISKKVDVQNLPYLYPSPLI